MASKEFSGEMPPQRLFLGAQMMMKAKVKCFWYAVCWTGCLEIYWGAEIVKWIFEMKQSYQRAGKLECTVKTNFMSLPQCFQLCSGFTADNVNIHIYVCISSVLNINLSLEKRPLSWPLKTALVTALVNQSGISHGSEQESISCHQHEIR